MSKFVKSSVLAVSVMLMAAVIVVGCSSPSSTTPITTPTTTQTTTPTTTQEEPGSQPANGLVQSNTGGSVTIDVEWTKAENGFLIFDVTMNTHSLDLDQYDLGELAVLRDDMGNEYHPVSWDSAPGGHHRNGILTFSLPDSVSQGEAKYVEMIIQDVAGIEERVLKWEL